MICIYSKIYGNKELLIEEKRLFILLPMNALLNRNLSVTNAVSALVIFSIERFFNFFRSVHPV